jgi:hypothetical protein
MTVLADFILVGHQSVGSYSLHTDKTGIFRTSLNSIANNIADVLNRHALPRLFMANGWRPEALPTIVPTDVDSPDISQLAQFMAALAGTGVNWFPDGDLENFIREAARLPQLDKDAIERRRQMQQRTEATAFAQINTEYIQAQQEVMMARMGQLPTSAMQPAISDAQSAEQQAVDGEQQQAAQEREDVQAQEQAELEGAKDAEGQMREDAQQGEQYEREDTHRAEDREHEMAQRKLDAKEKSKAKPKGKSRAK